VLRCFITHRSEDGVPLGALPLLSDAMIAPGIVPLRSVAERIDTVVLLGRQPGEPSASSRDAQSASLLRLASTPAARADLFATIMQALGFCHRMRASDACPEERLAFPASMQRVTRAEGAARWARALDEFKSGLSAAQLPWLAVTGARWSSPGGSVRVTPALVVALLGGKGLSRCLPEDIGAEFVELRGDDKDVRARAIVTSGVGGPHAYGHTEVKNGWCDVYVCSIGRESRSAESTALEVLKSVTAAVAHRFGTWRDCKPRPLCAACLLKCGCGPDSGAGTAAPSLPLSIVVGEQQCPWCRGPAAPIVLTNTKDPSVSID
jgi:hypothetical protein